MDPQPAHPPPVEEFAFDATGFKSRLMAAFDDLDALSPSTKQRIRFRLWRHLQDLSPTGFDDIGLGVDGYIAIAGLLGAAILPAILAVIWSWDQTIYLKIGAVVASELVAFVAFVAIAVVSEQGVERFNYGSRTTSAIYFGFAALIVLAIRGMPQLAPRTPTWLFDGLQAGLFGALVVPVTLTVVGLASPLFERLRHRNWSDDPAANIVVGLLELILRLESLSQFEARRDEAVREEIAVQRRRAEHLANIPEEKISNVQRSTSVSAQSDGTDLEVYELRATRSDGGPDITIKEERVLSRHTVEEWRDLRARCVRSIETVANFMEKGLPAVLQVGGTEADGWLRAELRGRARAVRNWARQIALPTRSESVRLLAQVATALERAAEEDWGALLKEDIPEQPSLRLRLWRAARKASLGLVALAVVLGAPLMGFTIPGPVRDSLLTFAIPWLLLQLLEFVAPEGGEHLAASKGIRELLPKF